MKTDGILLVNKPKGWTSHDIVAKVRNILKKQAGKKIKVGHTGTLDPMATGLMVLVVGKFTKKASEYSKLDKTYKATIKLGEISSTSDAEGHISSVNDKKPRDTEVKNVLEGFIGDIMQTPPAYSAVKIDGKRAYKLARSGQKVELEQRRVTIYDISEDYYKYPFISFTVSVSSGTYIRSLAEDIGKKLGTGGYLTELERTKVGQYRVENAKTIDKI